MINHCKYKNLIVATLFEETVGKITSTEVQYKLINKLNLAKFLVSEFSIMT